MTKHILLTGSEGFIGSHLAELLVRNGHKVRAMCLYNSFNHLGWLDDIDPHIRDEIDVVLGDVRDYDSVKDAMQGVDVVYNLAALIAIPYSYKAPESYVDTNVKGVLNVARAALDLNVEQVVHTSTSEVYGTAQMVPITEEHPLVGQSPYSASKIAADQLAYAYYCSFGLPVSIVRPFNTYGPRQSLRAVIPTIITQVINGTRELQLGNIDATRDFNYVEDTASGMASFLGKEASFGQVINLGTGVEVSIKDVVDMVGDICGVDLDIVVDSKRIRPEKSEVERLCACNKKAKRLLGWEPSYHVKQGLEATVDWFRSNGKAGDTQGNKYVI